VTDKTIDTVTKSHVYLHGTTLNIATKYKRSVKFPQELVAV
jgi:hypothetical protein